MLKSATYKEKFAMLKIWLPKILDSVKKDLKGEHLRTDIQFCKTYLPGKNINKLSLDDLVTAYSKALDETENGEALCEFISNRWLLKNTELYGYFEEKLKAIDPNFTELEVIDHAKSKDLITGAVAHFGAPKTYLFSVLNSVVFPKEIYQELAKMAQASIEKEETEAKALHEKLSFEVMIRNHELQIARLVDKYEKKLTGLQKKYIQDTESLKKQLVSLQRKLSK